ncbi:hypothetical protein PMAYCL1PPCAC_08957, partial [Pristionchus mayeri]
SIAVGVQLTFLPKCLRDPRCANMPQFAAKEQLPSSTVIFKLPNGTVFYCCFDPQKLYVRKNETELHASLADTISDVCSQGNAIYFTSNNQIFKAFLSPSDAIEIVFRRAWKEGEEPHYGGLCTIIRDKKKYAYRISENPDRGGIVLDASISELKDKLLREIHRGKVYFIARNPMVTSPAVHRLGNNVILIEAPMEDNLKTCAPQDSSPYLYFVTKKKLYTLNTETMEMLDILEIDGLDVIYYITGVFNGEISVVAKCGAETYLMTAALPAGYSHIDRNTTAQGTHYKDAMIQDLIENLEKQNIDNTSKEEIIKQLFDNVNTQLSEHKSKDEIIEGLFDTVEKSQLDNATKNKIIEELFEHDERLQQENATQSLIIDELIQNMEFIKVSAEEKSRANEQLRLNAQAAGTLCVACLEKPPNIVFYDCKHLAVCEDCLRRYIASGSTVCPKCRVTFRRTEKLFIN